MPKDRKFEDLICWQKARKLADSIYHLTRQSEFARDFTLRNQILGAAGSVMHNIAEGADAGTDREFTRFLKMSRRSVSEIQSELYLALDRGYITENDLQVVYDETAQVKRLINGLLSYLRKSILSNQGKVSDEKGEYAGSIEHQSDPFATD
jgi:four helix bundle protein